MVKDQTSYLKFRSLKNVRYEHSGCVKNAKGSLFQRFVNPKFHFSENEIGFDNPTSE